MAYVRSRIDKPNVGKELPNLKIEIENDLDNRMDTEELEVAKDSSFSEEESAEEGELVEPDDEGLGAERLHTVPLERLKNLNSGRSILRYDTKVSLNYSVLYKIKLQVGYATRCLYTSYGIWYYKHFDEG